MQLGKGIAIGFVAGLAVAFGAVLLLSDDDAEHAQDAVRLAQLDAQIQRLERSLSRLSGLVAAPQTVPAELSERVSEATAAVPVIAHRDHAELQAIAAADELVDRALYTGQWTREQAAELAESAANLDREEHGRILARVSAAINEGRLAVELP